MSTKEIIDVYRKEKNITYDDISKMTGLTPQTLFKIDKGASVDTYAKVAAALDIPIDKIFGTIVDKYKLALLMGIDFKSVDDFDWSLESTYMNIVTECFRKRVSLDEFLKCGISQESIDNMNIGKNPIIKDLDTIASFLDVPIGYLITKH